MWEKKNAVASASSGQEQPIQRKETKNSSRTGAKTPPSTLRKRRCHDCSRRTYNYRCEACWAKLRGQEEAIEVTPFDEIVG